MPWKTILRTLALAFAIVGSTQLVACNTMEGAGKDIEKGGEKLQDVADDAKR